MVRAHDRVSQRPDSGSAQHGRHSITAGDSTVTSTPHARTSARRIEGSRECRFSCLDRHWTAASTRGLAERREWLPRAAFQPHLIGASKQLQSPSSAPCGRSGEQARVTGVPADRRGHAGHAGRMLHATHVEFGTISAVQLSFPCPLGSHCGPRWLLDGAGSAATVFTPSAGHWCFWRQAGRLWSRWWHGSGYRSWTAHPTGDHCCRWFARSPTPRPREEAVHMDITTPILSVLKA